MSQVNVTINGRQFRMACEDGEEARLLRLAEDLDASIAQLRTRFGEIGDTRLTVMAALTLADQLSETKEKLQRLEPELATLRNASVASADRTQATQTRGHRRAQCSGRAHREHHQAPQRDGPRERRPDGMTIAFRWVAVRGLTHYIGRAGLRGA